MEDFIPFELSVKLKEKGYPQRTFGEYDMQGACYIEDGRFYENGCITKVARAYTAPTISQVLKWLREEKKIFVALNISWCFEDEEHPFYEVKEPMFKGYYSSVHLLKDLGNQDTYKSDKYDSFEQAALVGIEYVLDNLI